ncbi:MAG TPA: hypothetical protein VGN34_26940 [Ktedonobacteraceae bacterium]|jgi:hypothetical protein
MVSLIYSLLLTLLDVAAEKLKVWLLRFWCHRTGKRCRQATTPLSCAMGIEPLMVGSSSRSFLIPFVKFGMSYVFALDARSTSDKYRECPMLTIRPRE